MRFCLILNLFKNLKNQSKNNFYKFFELIFFITLLFIVVFYKRNTTISALLFTMSHRNGYIYARVHSSYDIYDACKIGKANNIPERDSQYATGEIKRGYFESVFEVPIEKLGIVERLIQNEFCDLHVKYDGGTEFYNKKIICLIEPYLIKLGIRYRKLSKQEISELNY